MKLLSRFLAPLWALALPFAGARAAEQPNILFIFADDQCFDTLRAWGNEEIETPNLDRLAASGTTFTHAYNMGSWSGAVCLASRAMLNVGNFVWHAKTSSENLQQHVEKGEMWSQLMAKAGYGTYFTGKWHVKANAKEIFQVAHNVRPGMPNGAREGYNRPQADGTDTWDPSDPKFGGYWKGGKHWSEIVGDDAVSYLETAKGKEEPFFIYAAFNAPHDPRQSPKEFVDKYPLENIAVPANFLPEYPYKEEMKSGVGLRDEKLAPFPRSEHAVKVNRQEYYAIITHMDVEIGKILDALEASGKADNTYIFFSADHGLAVGQHGLMGKQNMFDHSVRVPLIAAGPGIDAGAEKKAKVYLQDIMASSLELAGAERPDHVQFQSLMPILRGERDTQYDAIYGAYLDAQRAVTLGKNKLILYPEVPVALLFDLKEDPNEMNDILGSNPENLPLAKKLFNKLQKLQGEVGDELDLAQVYPELVE